MSTLSPVLWFGSKSRLASKIIKYFSKHKMYVEPFGGSAAVLLAKEPSGIEVFNDIGGEWWKVTDGRKRKILQHPARY
jgi:site-specific DNA-adenine methylase